MRAANQRSTDEILRGLLGAVARKPSTKREGRNEPLSQRHDNSMSQQPRLSRRCGPAGKVKFPTNMVDVDGTRAFDQRSNVCVDPRCRSVGCRRSAGAPPSDEQVRNDRANRSDRTLVSPRPPESRERRAGPVGLTWRRDFRTSCRCRTGFRRRHPARGKARARDFARRAPVTLSRRAMLLRRPATQMTGRA